MTATVPAAPSTARRAAWALTGGLAAAAWLLLVVWDRSPWGHLLDHEGTEAFPAIAALAVFVAGWVLMLVAMMLPTITPLVAMFGRMVSGRADRGRLLASLLAGYVVVWTTAGVVAYAADEVLHLADHRWSIVGERGWSLVAVAVAAAGVYQYTSLKERCLTGCRSPVGMIVAGWRGTAPTAEAFRIGRLHAWSCVGCCWALMLIMFAIGAANLGLMLLLAAIMTVEKVAAWGARITRPVGVVLLLVAAGIAAAHL